MKKIGFVLCALSLFVITGMLISGCGKKKMVSQSPPRAERLR